MEVASSFSAVNACEHIPGIESTQVILFSWSTIESFYCLR
jgi:hypothetical protein